MDFGPNPFKFYNAWVAEDDFNDIVKNAWMTQVQGTKMLQVVKKLKLVKVALRNWSKQKFGDFHQTNVTRNHLEGIQSSLDTNACDDSLCRMDKDTRDEFKKIIAMEESMLKQKSRIKWLNLGDQNNRFFHKSLLFRRA